MSSEPELFGFLNVHKPTGWTSRQVVDQVQRLVRPAKVGHAGTLDPLAEGVLILCIGPATRLVPFLHELPKAYVGEFQCGYTSDTADTDSEMRALSDAPLITLERIRAVLPRFTGRILQTPPIYSAVKVKGRRAYELARQGKTPDLSPREVEIHRLELREFAPPRLILEIECSSGTYVRSLGRDIARAVGSDAVMSRLVRTRIGRFALDASVLPNALTRETISGLMIPAATGVSHLRLATCEDDQLEDLRHGRAIAGPSTVSLREGDRCALLTNAGRLIAIGEYVAARNQIAPRHVFR